MTWGTTYTITVTHDKPPCTHPASMRITPEHSPPQLPACDLWQCTKCGKRWKERCVCGRPNGEANW